MQTRVSQYMYHNKMGLFNKQKIYQFVRSSVSQNVQRDRQPIKTQISLTKNWESWYQIW